MKNVYARLKNRRAFGLIQILIASGLMSLVSLGIMQMIENSRVVTRRINLLSTLALSKKNIETLMRDQVAFNNTILYNSSEPFTSIKAALNVDEATFANFTTPLKFVLYDAKGSAAYDMLGRGANDTAGAYNGLTEKGYPCSNFYIGAGLGRDDCPISYRMFVAADCPETGVTTCSDPQLKLVARLVYNPSKSNSSVLNRFRGLVAQIAGDSIADSVVDGKFDAVVKRTASSIAKSFKIVAYIPAGRSTAQCPKQSNGWLCGNCEAAGAVYNSVDPAMRKCNDVASTWLLHPLTTTFLGGAGFALVYDPHSLVTIYSVDSASFKFNVQGNYSCTIEAKAYGTNTFQLGLKNNNTSVMVGSGAYFAPNKSEVNVRLDVTFYVSNLTHYFSVVQNCESAIEGACSLGFSNEAVNSLKTPIVSVTCSAVEDAF